MLATADSSSPYSEERRKVIAFSHVAAGDKIRGRVVYKAKRADFAGEFADDGGAFAERSDRADAGLQLRAFVALPYEPPRQDTPKGMGLPPVRTAGW